MAKHILSVVIVNYRVKYFLAQTINSVLEALSGIDHEIFVVDNDSQDDSIEYQKKLFPNVKYIENKENVGFAKANNQAINLADSKYTLILNPDTVVCKETIMGAVDWMEQHDDCGGIGTKMIDGNGVFLPESKRSFPTPWVSFCKIFGLSKLFPYSRIFARYHNRYLSDEETHKIEIMAGAYMLIRTDLLQKIGGFDESFFMYGEDIDLSYRITKEGYSNYYLPLPIIHYKGESTKKDSFKYVKVFYDAMWIFFKKHFPNYSMPYFVFIKVGIFFRATIAMIKRTIFKAFGIKSQATSGFDKVIVLSSDYKSISELQKISNVEVINEKIDDLSDEIQNVEILLDNRYYSYGEIIRFVKKNTSSKRHFQIYLDKADKIITPKMQS